MSKDIPAKPSAKSSPADAAPAPGSLAAFDPERSRSRFKEWFPQLNDSAVQSLVIYATELTKFNKTINLVSPQTLASADAVHLADAVLAYKYMKRELVPGAPLYDFGSGNGIPGLVIALIEPQLKVILVDRDERKLEFCKHVANACKATNVTTLKADVDKLPKGSVINAVARGFAPLPKALLIARTVIAKGGKFFHLKGDGFAAELSAVPSQLFTYWQPRMIGEYRLPERGIEMALICTDKIAT